MPGEDGDNCSGIEDEREDPEKESDTGTFNIMRHAKRKQQKTELTSKEEVAINLEKVYENSANLSPQVIPALRPYGSAAADSSIGSKRPSASRYSDKSSEDDPQVE